VGEGDSLAVRGADKWERAPQDYVETQRQISNSGTNKKRAP